MSSGATGKQFFHNSQLLLGGGGGGGGGGGIFSNTQFKNVLQVTIRSITQGKVTSTWG